MSARQEKMARELAERLRPIREKIEGLSREIDDLSRKLGEATAAKKHLVEVLIAMGGEASPEAPSPPPTGTDDAPRRTRTPNVKGVVLDIMRAAGQAGRTSAEVLADAHSRGVRVSRDTVSSVLSRLKADGALTYDGLRYYEASNAPKDGNGKPPHIRVVG